MSLNLGQEACEALRQLRAYPATAVFVDGIRELARQQTNRALDASPEQAQMLVGYARCMRDFAVAIESAVTNKPQQQVKAPGAVAAKGV